MTEPILTNVTKGDDPVYPTDIKYEYNDPAAGNFTCYPVPKYPGLTKREWLAGLAMQGLLANPNTGYASELMAKTALQMTDALIAKLAKGEGK